MSKGASCCWSRSARFRWADGSTEAILLVEPSRHCYSTPLLPSTSEGHHTMARFACLLALFVFTVPAAAKAPLPKPLVEGLKNPHSICIGPDGRIYVSVMGELQKDGDGAIMSIRDGKALPFATGLDDPKGLVAFQNWLF